MKPRNTRRTATYDRAMPASTVVFDWYATLAAPNPDDFWTRLPEIVAGAGGDPRPDVLAAWEQDHPSAHPEHSASERAYRAWQRRRLDAVFESCRIAEPARSNLLDRIDDLRYNRLFAVFPDVRAAIEDLTRRGVRVGICSNWDWDLDRHLAHNEIGKLVEFVVCSAQVGYRKPHPSIFAVVLDHAGVPPAEIVFVGDDWHDDISGARAAGFTPVHLQRSGACPVTDHRGVACTSTLDQVLELCA